MLTRLNHQQKHQPLVSVEESSSALPPFSISLDASKSCEIQVGQTILACLAIRCVTMAFKDSNRDHNSSVDLIATLHTHLCHHHHEVSFRRMVSKFTILVRLLFYMPLIYHLLIDYLGLHSILLAAQESSAYASRKKVIDDASILPDNKDANPKQIRQRFAKAKNGKKATPNPTPNPTPKPTPSPTPKPTPVGGMNTEPTPIAGYDNSVRLLKREGKPMTFHS